jgi:glycosyltransferase involved in cell wall biosynthesis
MEAMACGVPIATSDYQALPEMVDFGKAGLISPCGDASALAANLLRLLEPEENRRYSQLAHAHFTSTYAASAVRSQLRASYERTAHCVRTPGGLAGSCLTFS